MRVTVLSALLLATGAAAVPLRAEACSCPEGAGWLLLPRDGDTGVPTNARIWAGEPIELLGPDGIEVPLTTFEVWTTSGVVVSHRPETELQPSSSYTITARRWGISSTFTTGEGPDTVAPAAPTMQVIDSSWTELGSCGELLYVAAEADHDGAMVVVDTNEPEAFDSGAWAGRVDDVFTSDRLVLGRGICTWNIREPEPGGTASVRLLSIDLAGNVSAWGPSETIEFDDTFEPDPTGGGVGGTGAIGGTGGAGGSGGAGGVEEDGGTGAAGAGGDEGEGSGEDDDVSAPTRDGCDAAGGLPSFVALALVAARAIRARKRPTDR